MSANDLPLFLGMVVEAILAVGAAFLWTVFKPRSSNPRLFWSFYVANRYMLAGSIFYYGWGKVLLLQFAPSLDYFAFEVAQHSPNDLLWAFMTGSSSYQFFAGVIEVTAALLLLSRRTVIAGALLSLAAMGNVLALDLGYDVSVKFIALEMFLMALFAVVPYWAVLAAVLLRHVTPRADAWPQTIILHKFSRGSRIVALIVTIWLVTATLYDTVRLRATVLENRRTPLSGIWDVEQITRDGTDVPLVITNPELWRRFVFQSKNAAVVFPMSNYPLPRAGTGRANGIRYEMRLDESTHSVRLTPFPMSGTNDALIFDYSVVDTGHLELTTADSRIAVRLRRFDVGAYPLVSWERRWSW
jgi:hypothetical protein